MLCLSQQFETSGSATAPLSPRRKGMKNIMVCINEFFDRLYGVKRALEDDLWHNTHITDLQDSMYIHWYDKPSLWILSSSSTQSFVCIHPHAPYALA